MDLETRMQEHRGEAHDGGYVVKLLSAPIDDWKQWWQLDKLVAKLEQMNGFSAEVIRGQKEAVQRYSGDEQAMQEV